MIRHALRSSILAAAILAGACTTAPAKRENSAFLWLRSIDGFHAIDDEHVVLSAGSKHALVTLFGFCDGLRFSESIGIDAPLDHLDERGVGHIVYRRGPHDTARCPIDRLVAVKDVKEAKAIVAAEKAAKAAAKAKAS